LSRVEEIQFEPMSLGALLDRTFHLYAQNFALVVGIAALAYLPLLLVQVLGVFLTPATSDDPTLAEVAALFVLLLGGMLMFLFFVPLATGATTKAISERYLGRETTATAALKAAVYKIIPLLVTQFIVSLIIFAGIVLFIVPGIFFALSYMLVAPVAILETSSPGRIRRRSWDLVSGSRWRVLGVVAVIIGLQLAPAFVLGALTGVVAVTGVEIPESLLSGLALAIDYLGQILVAPLGTVAITLLYYDLRIRKEGFDLEMLSEAMHAPASGE
jgi:hypothetical protein